MAKIKTNAGPQGGASIMPTGGNASWLMPTGGGMPVQPNAAMVAQAISKMRSSLQRRGEDGVKTGITKAGVANDVANVWLWERAVRVRVCADEAVSGLNFDGATVRHMAVAVAGNGAVTGMATSLVAFTRPADYVFKAQVALTLDAAAERPDVLEEILLQMQDLWPFWSALTHIDPETAPRTAELFDVAFEMATNVTTRLKHELACPRPVDVSVLVAPVATTPGHGALPSGHATSAFLAARLFTALLGLGLGDPLREMLFRLAHRMAHHRVVAGFHFEIDSVAGRLLGEQLADYFVALCSGAVMFSGAVFAPQASTLLEDGTLADADLRDYRSLKLPSDQALTNEDWDAPLVALAVTEPRTAFHPAQRDLLNALWLAAQTELTQLKLI